RARGASHRRPSRYRSPGGAWETRRSAERRADGCGPVRDRPRNLGSGAGAGRCTGRRRAGSGAVRTGTLAAFARRGVREPRGGPRGMTATAFAFPRSGAASGIRFHALTIARFTIHEAISRRLILAASLLSLLFVGLYALGFSFVFTNAPPFARGNPTTN